MTSETIEASYLLTPDECVKCFEAPKRGFGQAFGEIVYFCIGAALISGTVRVVCRPTDTVIFALFPVLTLVFFLYWNFGGRRHNFKNKFMRMLRTQGLLDQKVVWVVDNARFRIVTAVSDSFWRWVVVTKVIESREGFIIYVHALGHWLPYHAFRHDEDRDRFRELVAANVAQFAPLK